MRRPISIAMAISVVIHGAFLVLVVWLISDSAQPSISTALLTVSIRSSQAQDDQSAEEVPESRTAIRETAAPENNTPAPAPQVATDHEHIDIEDSIASASAGTPATQPEVITTVSKSEVGAATGVTKTARRTITQTALSPRQEKMLTRKFEEWAENFHKMPDTTVDLLWNDKGQEYVAKFTDLMAEGDMGIQNVIVEVSTEEGGKRLSTEMRMKRLAFSSFAQFINRWDPNVQVHNDELTGRFHSNSVINLAYNRKVKPQFHGEVTTSARKINIVDRRGHVSRDEIFLGGLQTGVKAIGLPKQFLPLAGEAPVSEHQIHHFDEDARLTFYADGSYAWQAVESGNPPKMIAMSESTTYLIAAKNVDLHVKGTVNGKVLVYSPQRIVIEDDLVYAQDPAETPDADDYLGLVSDKYVEIAPPSVTGPGDLVINAAIYAKRRFAVKRYRSRDNVLLYIYGSLTAGSISASEPRYYTRIQYDQRLDKLRPPGFPMTNRYVVDFWDNTWKVEPIEVSP